MALPRALDPSPHDPLLLRPLPSALPADPTALVSALSAELHAFIDAEGAADPLLLNTLAAGVRHATRSAQASVNAGRVRSSEARAELDAADADLRAAMYELGRVRDAIAECDAYTPAYEELELVPEDEYLQGADEAVLAGLREYLCPFWVAPAPAVRGHAGSELAFVEPQADRQHPRSRNGTTRSRCCGSRASSRT